MKTLSSQAITRASLTFANEPAARASESANRNPPSLDEAHLPQGQDTGGAGRPLRDAAVDARVKHADEYPVTVREAAKFLGVSPQTVYLWVERKQIPHLRVMGRNIRFLKSDLEPFRASFKQEMENA